MYVIYKEIVIPNIGAIHPKGIETMIANYNGWNLAICPNELISDYAEFDLVGVSDEIATGMIVNNNLGISNDGMGNNVVFSTSEIALAEAAKEFINKLNNKYAVRAKINEYKDIEDDLVDLKRIVFSMLRFALDDWNNKSDKEKNESGFKNIIPSLHQILNTETGLLPSFIDDIATIEKILDTENEIKSLVDAFYLVKK